MSLRRRRYLYETREYTVDNGKIIAKIKGDTIKVLNNDGTGQWFAINWGALRAPGAEKELPKFERLVKWVRKAKSYKQAERVFRDAIRDLTGRLHPGAPQVTGVFGKYSSKITREVTREITGGRRQRKTPPQSPAPSGPKAPPREREVDRSGSLQIANTILQQLGGHKFVMMTGAKDIVALDAGIQFKIPKGKGGINFVKIELNRGRDTYDVEFSRKTFSLKQGAKTIVKKKLSDIYWDQLVRIFENTTGLRTKLF
jgi:hypothetical protein